MRAATRIASWLGFASIVICLSGCSTHSTKPVNGKIVYSDGAPATDLVGHIVSFDCAEHNAGASGVVQADGTFKLGTYSDDDGALPGVHRVAISPPEPPVDAPVPLRLIDKKYGDMNTSGFEVTITSGTNDVVLKVDRAKR